MVWRPHYIGGSDLAHRNGASLIVEYELIPFTPTHRLRSIEPGYTRKWIHEDYVLYDQAPGERMGWGLLPAFIGSGPEETPPYCFDPKRGPEGTWMSMRPWPGRGAVAVAAETCRIRGASRLETLGAVYFVRPDGADVVKIGWSTDVARRVAELQTANAATLRVIATMAGTLITERSLHERFASARCEGEWFDLRSSAAAGADLLVTINTLRGLSGLTPITLDVE